MSVLSLADLGVGTSFAGADARGQPVALDRAEAFEDALAHRTAIPAETGAPSLQASEKVADLRGAPPVDAPAAPGATVVDRERVLRSLDLAGAPSAPSAGDTILGGLQKLRSVFDARQAHLTDIMSSPVASTQALLAMQMEVAQYTVMVDVSSKLTGKASSSLDTLMKGQ